jgi:tetratricopeptide (TPR) repeat protein
VAARLAELEERSTEARLDFADSKLAVGRHAEVIAEMRCFLADRPLCERAWHVLMLAYAAAGQRDRSLDAYREARAQLVGELGIEPTDALQRAHREILSGHEGRSAPVTLAAPQPLPPGIGCFTGREGELAALDAILPAAGTSPSATTTCVITGPGGVGKTLLAVHWARQVSDRFPDGELYVDLRGFSPGAAPVRPAEAVHVLLGFLGVPRDGMPPTFEEQLGLYRTVLSGRRILLILDNVRESDQVRPLLPHAPGSLVLMTSRAALTGLVAAEGAHLVRLEPLSDTEATELLRRRLGADRTSAEPGAVAEIVAACAGLPLALGIIAARALGSAALPLATLAGELREEGARLDALDTGEAGSDLREVFGSSYRALAGGAALALTQLGLATGPDIGLPAAARLFDLPAAPARRVLRTLETASLLHRHADGRYRMHDLVRLCAIERVDPELGAAAAERLVTYYLRTSYLADRRLSPHRRGSIGLAVPPQDGPTDAAGAYVWFRNEHACLLAAQQLAVEHGLHRAAWQLAWTLDTFHLRDNLNEECLASWRIALRAVAQMPGRAEHALVHRMLGRACARAACHVESFAHFGVALATYSELGDVAGAAHVHHGLAVAWEDGDDHEHALVELGLALPLYRAVGDEVGEANVLNSMGWNRAMLADFGAAAELCEQAMVLLRRHTDRVGEAATLDSLGYIAHHTGHLVEALDFYQGALAMRRDNGNASQVAETLAHLGETYREFGRFAEAGQAWRQAAAIYADQHRVAKMSSVRARLDALPCAAPVGNMWRGLGPSPE